jgi:hypothetical protein
MSVPVQQYAAVSREIRRNIGTSNDITYVKISLFTVSLVMFFWSTTILIPSFVKNIVDNPLLLSLIKLVTARYKNTAVNTAISIRMYDQLEIVFENIYDI